MHFLVTGGIGYLGGRIAQHISALGHKVTVASRKNYIDAPSWLPQANVKKINWPNDSDLINICLDVDIVIHAAGMNAKDCEANPAEALEFNGECTARLFEAAQSAKVRRFVYLSTAHIYANPLVGDINEATTPSNLHPYATSHLAGELSLLNAKRQSPIQVIILRLSNVIGAPAHKDVNSWSLLVNDLCRQAVETRFIRLNSNGKQQRDFIPITEVCRIISALTTNFYDCGEVPILNLGSGKSYTVIEMASLIQSRCNNMLNYMPRIEITNKDNYSPIIDKLNYRIEKLQSLGLSINTDPTGDIDQLLLFCRNQFQKEN